MKQTILLLIISLIAVQGITFYTKQGGSEYKCANLKSFNQDNQIVYVATKIKELKDQCYGRNGYIYEEAIETVTEEVNEEIKEEIIEEEGKVDKTITHTIDEEIKEDLTEYISEEEKNDPQVQLKWTKEECKSERVTPLCFRRECCKSLYKHVGDVKTFIRKRCRSARNVICVPNVPKFHFTKEECHSEKHGTCLRKKCCKWLVRTHLGIQKRVKHICRYDGKKKCERTESWGNWECQWKSINDLCTREHCCRKRYVTDEHGYRPDGHEHCEFRGGQKCRNTQKWTDPTCETRNTNSHCTRQYCCKRLEINNGNGWFASGQQSFWQGNENCRTEWRDSGRWCHNANVGNNCFQYQCCTNKQINTGSGWRHHSQKCEPRGGRRCVRVCVRWGNLLKCTLDGNVQYFRFNGGDVHLQTLSKKWVHFRYFGAFKYLYYKDVKIQVVAKSVGKDSAFSKIGIKKEGKHGAVVAVIGYENNEFQVKLSKNGKKHKVNIGGAYTINGLYLQRTKKHEVIVILPRFRMVIVADGRTQSISIDYDSTLNSEELHGIVKEGKPLHIKKTFFDDKVYEFGKKSGKFVGTKEEKVAAYAKAEKECARLPEEWREFCIEDNVLSGLDWTHEYERVSKDEKDLSKYRPLESAKRNLD